MRCLFCLVLSSGWGEAGWGGLLAMQCFTIWIAIQFLHDSCLSLFHQFQYLGLRSYRGGSASRTKGTTDMSTARKPGKRVHATRQLSEPGVLTRSGKNKHRRQDGPAGGEHNS
jgi:hypothetical protein